MNGRAKRHASRAMLERRLQSWIVEKQRNQHGLAHMADRSIAHIRALLKPA